MCFIYKHSWCHWHLTETWSSQVIQITHSRFSNSLWPGIRNFGADAHRIRSRHSLRSYTPFSLIASFRLWHACNLIRFASLTPQCQPYLLFYKQSCSRQHYLQVRDQSHDLHDSPTSLRLRARTTPIWHFGLAVASVAEASFKTEGLNSVRPKCPKSSCKCLEGIQIHHLADIRSRNQTEAKEARPDYKGRHQSTRPDRNGTETLIPSAQVWGLPVMNPAVHADTSFSCRPRSSSLRRAWAVYTVRPPRPGYWVRMSE